MKKEHKVVGPYLKNLIKRKPYESPAVVYESVLEVRAGSPVDAHHEHGM